MGFNGRNRSFTTLQDFTPREIRFLLDLSRAKYGGYERGSAEGQEHRDYLREDVHPDARLFRGRGLRPGRTRDVPRPNGTQIGHKESMKDTARVLGRIYDAIEYRGYGQEIVEELAKYGGVPVWNGLTDEFHPTPRIPRRCRP